MRSSKKASFAAGLVAAQLSVLFTVGAPSASAALPPSEWVVGQHRKVVYLTFEGAVGSKRLLTLVDRLETKKVKAAFFMPGSWINSHKLVARKVLRAGHFLGNRGYSKASFTTLSSDEIRSSIARAQEALENVGAAPAPFLRAPRGDRDLRVLQAAGSMGYRSVAWTTKPGSGKPGAVARRAVRRAQLGSIISLELSRSSNRRAVPRIIDGLRRRRGFSLRPINGLANAHAIRWDVTVRAGSSGSEVTYLQDQLKRTSYPAGPSDGSFGYATQQAVYAFEKVFKLPRDGVVTPAQMTQIALEKRPTVRTRGYKTMINIDVSRQVVFEVRNGKVKHTIPMSSGNEEYYESEGQTYKAHTPRGDFSIERKIEGERVSHLGTLYNPLYFVGGYALHGSESVPTYPASHGCVRLPMYVSKPFFNRHDIGEFVWVHD
jgi:peptidoglycan/xylan/chitin deacetylase (PgdA/CDA1 family)/lipoprotein-anchoring transpeptidase ErfK/SrfK